MGVPSGSYFFARMNRIGSVVELKFYIKVQEEDIRMQEEFVNITEYYYYYHLSWAGLTFMVLGLGFILNLVEENFDSKT